MLNKRLKQALIWADIMGKVIKEYVVAIKQAPNKLPAKRYSYIAHDFGLNKDTYDNMLKDQGHTCAICHNKFDSNKDTHVDHNHKTGATRGLLCFKCNVLLGNSNENIDILLQAIEYIKHHSRVPVRVPT